MKEIPDNVAKAAAVYANKKHRLSGESSDVDDVRKAIQGKWLGSWGESVCDFVAGVTQREETQNDPSTAGVSAAAKDVEGLLRETDMWLANAHDVFGGAVIGVTMVHELATALREARANMRRALWGERACWGHLRAVLEFMWPGNTGGPSVVQKARAFLAGEEHTAAGETPGQAQEAWARLVNGSWSMADAQVLQQEVRLRRDARQLELLRKELADKGAALERMVLRWEAERDARRNANEECARLRVQLATDDEAATHLRAAVNDALAAQNRAESEAAGLRRDLDEVRGALSEARAESRAMKDAIDGLTMWAKKGRA